MPNKIVTQVPVTVNELDRLNVESVASVLSVHATYHVLDINGVQLGNQRAITITLTPAQLTTLTTFIASTVLPAMNTAEGT